jgi:hypothetical protein
MAKQKTRATRKVELNSLLILRVPRTLHEEIKDQAKAEERTLSQMARILLKLGLAENKRKGR